MSKRRDWLRDLRRVDERQEDALAGDFDAHWGEIEPMHHDLVGRFLSRLPPDGRVLDAACGTGKSFPMVLASARGLLGTTTLAPSWPTPPSSSLRSPPPSMTSMSCPTGMSSMA